MNMGIGVGFDRLKGIPLQTVVGPRRLASGPVSASFAAAERLDLQAVHIGRQSNIREHSVAFHKLRIVDNKVFHELMEEEPTLKTALEHIGLTTAYQDKKLQADSGSLYCLMQIEVSHAEQSIGPAYTFDENTPNFSEINRLSNPRASISDSSLALLHSKIGDSFVSGIKYGKRLSALIELNKAQVPDKLNIENLDLRIGQDVIKQLGSAVKTIAIYVEGVSLAFPRNASNLGELNELIQKFYSSAPLQKHVLSYQFTYYGSFFSENGDEKPALIELEKRIKQSLQTRLGLKLLKDEAVNCLDSMGLHFKILAGIREGLTQLEYSYIADDPYNKLMDKSYQDFRVLFDKITEALSSQKPFNLDASTDISEGSSGAAVLASSTGTGHALAESGSAGAAGGVIASNDAPTESPDTVLKKYETELTRIKYSLIKLGSKELIKKIEISSRVGCNPYLRSQSSQVFKLKLPKETQALYFSAEENGSPAPTSGMAELPSSQAVEDQVLGWPIRDISIKNRVGYTLYRLTDTQRTLTTPININEKSLYLKTGYGQTNYTVRIFSVVPFPISLNLSPKFARFEGIVPSLMSNLTMQPVVAVPRPIDSETSLLRFDDSRRVNPYAVEGLPQSDINLIQHAAREALATNPGDIRTSAERGARLALVMTKLTQQGQALEGPSHFQELAGQRQIAMARYNMEQELRSYAAEIHAQEEEIAELKGKLKDSSTQIGALFRELQSKDAVIARLTKRLTKIPGEPGSSESLGWRGAAPLQAAASEGDSDAIKRIWQSVQAGFPFEEPLVGPKQNEAAGTGLTRPLPRTPEAPQASESDALKRAWQNQAVNPFENPSIQKPHSVLHSIAAAGTGLVAGLSPRTPEAPKPPEAPSRLLLPPEAPSRLLPPTP